MSLKDQFNELMERLSRAAQQSGRSATEIEVVGVSKTVSLERIEPLLKLGIRHIGENKVQEAERKAASLKLSGAVLHMLGHLQTNKARKAVEIFDLIQSVDSERLATVLNRVAGEVHKVQEVLVEVKTTDEPTKSGVELGQAPELLRTLMMYPQLRVRGLMTIGPNSDSIDEARASFRTLKNLFEANRDLFGEHPILSMGMSQDFEVAIEEGSTMIRIGRALFGERGKK